MEAYGRAGPLAVTLDVKVVDQFSNKRWRLANLYYIIDDSGKEVLFRPNEMQVLFLEELWYLNEILKGRQHGFTTLIDLWTLDECVFHAHLTAGIIAHTLDDVKKIFRRKIKNPYERLPDGIRLSNPATNDTANELIFKNKSEISVDTSMRSGTMNILHISEFGQIALKYPEKAVEIKTGSFNTVHPGNYLFVESTGHGKGGEFYNLDMAAKAFTRSHQPFTKMDFKRHFFPWWMNPKYSLDINEAKHVVFTRQDHEYFGKVKKKIDSLIARYGSAEAWLRYWQKMGSELTLGQKAWYIKKRQWNGDEMKREYPSHDEEPFEAVIEGAVFGPDMARVRAEGRITKLRHEPALAVNTWWDIGRRDKTAIWFYQMLGNELRFIRYEENSFKGLPYYITLLNTLRTEKKWNYGTHLGPHDLAVTEFGSDKTRWETAKNLGYVFNVSAQYSERDQTDAARAALAISIFDEEECAVGIAHLEAARKEWNDHLQMYAESMRHDEHSHGASSYMNGAMNLNLLAQGKARALPVVNQRFAT